MDIEIIVERQTELFQVVFALNATSRLAGLLYRRKQQGDQNRNNRNHDQQFDECETVPTTNRHNLQAPVHDPVENFPSISTQTRPVC